MKTALIIMMLTITGSYGTASAQQAKVVTSDKTGWHKIGETTVNFQKESDEIIVMGADRFASIKFKVTEAPINLMSMTVYYESGDNQDIQVNSPIELKGESKVFDLNGGERSLKKIVFVYKTYANRKDTKGHVEVWGLKTNSDKK